MIACIVTLFMLPGCVQSPRHHPPAQIIQRVPLPVADPRDRAMLRHSNPEHRAPAEAQLRAFAAPVTRSFGRSTNRPVVN
jgi:hypothetical protein